MADEFRSTVELLEKSAAKFAHKPLFGTKTGGTWRWITYDEFRKDVDRFRSALATLGVGPGDRVAIIGNNSVEWALAAHATYGRGGAYVPMYESQAPEEWEFILRDSASKVVIAGTPAIHAELVRIQGRVPTLAHVVGIGLHESNPQSFRSHLLRGGAAPARVLQPEPTDVAGLVYTSGTTGMPKGVILTHKNVCSNVSAVCGLFPFGSDERSLAFLPWAHAFGQTCELHVLTSIGSSMALNDRVERIVDNLSEVRPTVLYAVPRIFNRIYDGVNAQMKDRPAAIRALFKAGIAAATKRSRGDRLGVVERTELALADRLIFSKVRARFGGRLKMVVSGSAALSLEVAEFIDALGIPVYEGYGLTETSPVATTNFPDNRKIGSVGRAIPGVRIDIDTSAVGDAAGPNGKVGEVVIHGPNVMRGYHERPEENAEIFSPDGGLRSGDLGYLDADGYLFITGRIKEQYKLTNGKYVVPAPLEEELKLSPYISNAMLHGANKPHNVVLLVVDRPALDKWAKDRRIAVHDPAHDDHVQELLHRELEERTKSFKGYEKPERFLVVADEFTVENGMLTPTLKLKRRKVMERYGQALEGLY